ncbi:BrnT family toxin [Methylorubrum rhodinum]
MLMVWDEPKRERNRLAPPAGHGLDFVDARDRFEWDTAMILPAKASARGEERHMAVGFLDGQLVALVFAYHGTEAISAISLRRASNRERRDYAEQSQA